MTSSSLHACSMTRFLAKIAHEKVQIEASMLSAYRNLLNSSAASARCRDAGQLLGPKPLCPCSPCPRVNAWLSRKACMLILQELASNTLNQTSLLTPFTEPFVCSGQAALWRYSSTTSPNTRDSTPGQDTHDDFKPQVRTQSKAECISIVRAKSLQCHHLFEVVKC